MKKDLLLHICCGVCASRVIEILEPQYNITGYFYNPNIEPPDEYQQRLQATETVLNYYKINLIHGEYENPMWHEAVVGLEHWAEGGRRCWQCFRLRLDKTAQKAKEKSIPCFATTLIVNPYKNSDVIDKWGQHYTQVYDLEYVPIKLDKNNRYDLILAKKLNIYRQKYCGCVYSAPI